MVYSSRIIFGQLRYSAKELSDKFEIRFNVCSITGREVTPLISELLPKSVTVGHFMKMMRLSLRKHITDMQPATKGSQL